MMEIKKLCLKVTNDENIWLKITIKVIGKYSEKGHKTGQINLSKNKNTENEK